MSAAATAAGYLYASGRLRGRGGKEEGAKEEPRERKVKVRVYEPEAPVEQPKPKRTPKIEYRTRRWTPNE
jgi:hypothetical protein